MMKAARNDLLWALLFAGALACESGTTNPGSEEREAGAMGVLGGDASLDTEPGDLDARAVEIVAENDDGQSSEQDGGDFPDAGDEPLDAASEPLDAGSDSPDAGDSTFDADLNADDAEASVDADAQLADPDAGDGEVPEDAGAPRLEAAADTAVSPPPPRLCTERCVADQDCREEEFGFESCVEGQCTAACTSDDACSDKGAQGRAVCSADTDCAASEACVVLGNGDRRCATSTALAACGAPEWPRMRPRAETGAPVEVCLTSLRCSPQGCVRPCRGQCRGGGVPSSCDAESGLCVCLADTDCGRVANAPSCDVASGRCVCRADADCTDAHAPYCNVETGTCQCNTDAQCGDDAVCRAGSCVQTCEEASSCLHAFPATTVSCE